MVNVTTDQGKVRIELSIDLNINTAAEDCREAEACYTCAEIKADTAEAEKPVPIVEGTFTDPRDGKQYRTVKIGEQTWLAENLDWEGAGVWYNNSQMFGNFGRLYTWNEALKVAPPGWHLPTDEEWQKLVDFAGGNEAAADKLRAKDGWAGNGNDEFGFSALPGGYRYRDGDFDTVGDYGNWWSATERDSDSAYRRNMNSGGAKVYRNDLYKDLAFSVRLLQD